MKQLRSMLSSTTKEKAIGHREDIRREMSDAANFHYGTGGGDVFQ